MKAIGIIPARYASTRFPGKPLASIKGKSMINRVYEQASKATSLHDVFIATDDERIYNAVSAFGGKVFMTSPDHPSGTERCNELAEKFLSDGSISKQDIVINIQGDEPFIHPGQINELTEIFEREKTEIATLVKSIANSDELFNENIAKVLIDKNKNAIYFSRQAIPFIRGVPQERWLENFEFYKHVGIYGFTVDALGKAAKLDQTVLEKAESLEQLRWLEHGFKIRIGYTEYDNHPVDIPEDLLKFQ